LRQHKVELYAAVPKRPGQPSLAIDEVDLSRRCGIVIGSEAHGVGEDLRAAATDVSIPTVGVESLNAAVAAGILLYEARRQRAVA
jgi:TrmH family RNA methyltransferase